MTPRDEIISALNQKDGGLIPRALITASELLGSEPFRHRMTAHELVVQATEEILEGLHDAEYTQNHVAFFRLVMEKILIAARKKASRRAAFGRA